MKLPKIDLSQLKRQKEENLRERLEFIDMYANWLKKQPNKKWSSQQKDVVNL